MTMRSITAVFLVCLAVAIAVYDVVALLRGGGRATISSVIMGAAYYRPYGALLPLAFGILIGHLLWAQKTP